jgi:nucleotide-binding universal stress UspA family protein
MAFEHVLVATDGSDKALKAASVAGELVRALGARVSVLYVQDDALVVSSAWGASGAAGGTVQGTMSVEQIRSMLEQQAHDTALAKALEALGNISDNVQSAVVWGHPASEICRFARENGVDLIVIGSHGRSGIQEALLGSVSHSVANRASCPVTIVR